MTKLKEILDRATTVGNLPYFLRAASPSAGEQEVTALKHELQMLSEWVMKKRQRFSEQELEDFNDELLRAWIMFSHKAMQLDIEQKKIKLSGPQSTRMEYVNGMLESQEKLNQNQKDRCIKYLDYVAEKYPSLNVNYASVTNEERKMIVKAMGFRQGHWFKCPQGHIYCIGECGGATEESKCPECGSKVGGTQHRLLSDNQLAPEMDNARFAAWSDTANDMGNWIFD